jgi:predicted PurR-regulated permease PerM
MQTQKVSVSQIFITAAAFVVVIAGMRAATSIVVPFFLSAFIAIVSTPPMFWLQRKGLPSWLAMLCVIMLVLISVVLVSGLIGSSIKDFTANLPNYQVQFDSIFATVIKALENLGVDTSNLGLNDVFNPGSVMRLVAAGLSSFQTVLTNGFLILMTVIFMLMEASNLPNKLKLIMGEQENALDTFDQFVTNVKQYMEIKTLVSLGTGAIVALGLFILGVDYPLLWGLLAFLLNYIPNIGSIIAAIPPVLLAMIQLGFGEALIVAALFLSVNIIMGNVVEPRFMGRGLGLSTLVVFLSLLFWGWVLGPVGMLLSVPLTITVKIALASHEDSRWLAILLGPDLSSTFKQQEDQEATEDNET